MLRLKVAKLKRFASKAKKGLSIENCGLSEKEIRFIKLACKNLNYGTDFTAELQIANIIKVLQTGGFTPTERRVQAALEELKITDLESYSFVHLLHIWANIMKDVYDEAKLIRLAFDFFDRDGGGYITKEEFCSTMADLGDPLHEGEFDIFLEAFDTNHDGKIQYLEFLEALSTQKEKILELLQLDEKQEQ